MKFNHFPVIPCRITSGFGKRNTGIKGASTFHKGIDFGGSGAITPIYAVRRGTIEKSYWNKVRGWVLVIKHDEHYSTLYQHLAEKSPLPVGAYVMAGDRIGTMGNTSETLKISKHLHMELWKDGTPIDFADNIKNTDGEIEMDEKELRSIIQEEIKKIVKPAGEVADWAKADWQGAKDAGIIDGSNPRAFATRQEVITILARERKTK